MYSELREIVNMRPGSIRRRQLVAWFQKGTPEEPRQMRVNAKWVLQTHRDPDLKILLKKGILVRERLGGHPKRAQLNEGTSKKPVFKCSAARLTYLVLAPK